MTKVTITADKFGSPDVTFRAATRGRESTGHTPGAALDALADQLPSGEKNTFIVVQNMQADEFFTASQRQRLAELLDKRRMALDAGEQMEATERVELEALVDAELDGATKRAAAMINELRS